MTYQGRQIFGASKACRAGSGSPSHTSGTSGSTLNHGKLKTATGLGEEHVDDLLHGLPFKTQRDSSEYSGEPKRENEGSTGKVQEEKVWVSKLTMQLSSQERRGGIRHSM